MPHWSVTNIMHLSGYLWVSPGAGESMSSCNGSRRSVEAIRVSSRVGTACFLIGHPGSSGSIRDA